VGTNFDLKELLSHKPTSPFTQVTKLV